MSEKKSDLDLMLERLSGLLIVLLCVCFAIVSVELLWEGFGMNEIIRQAVK